MRIGKRQDDGFAMVALLVGMSIAAIWMAASLPKWGQLVQRQREADLIYRGEQYARAIMLYMDKNQNTRPPNIAILISQRYLRKKFKDTLTNDEFAVVGIGVITTGWTDPNKAKKFGCQLNLTSGAQMNTSGQQPGISGVRSKSCLSSIKVYQNQQAHNLFPFDAAVYRQIQNQYAPRNVPGPPGQGGQPGRDGGRPGGTPGRGEPGRGGLPGDFRPTPPTTAPPPGRGGGRGLF